MNIECDKDIERGVYRVLSNVGMSVKWVKFFLIPMIFLNYIYSLLKRNLRH